MDSRVRRRSKSDLAVEILLLIPFLAYAVAEILVCCFWNLILRSFCELGSLLLNGFYRNLENERMTRQVPLKDKNSPQNVALTISQLHKDQTSLLQRDKDFHRSAESPENCAAREKLQTKENLNRQNVQTKANKDERTLRQRPRLITTKWVTQNTIWKVDRDTVNIIEDDALLHINSAAESDSEGKHQKEDAHRKGKIPTHDLEEQKCSHGRKESERDPRQQKIFGVNRENDDVLFTKSNGVKGCRHSQVCSRSHLNAAPCDSTKENVEGFTQANKPISDRLGTAEEKSYSNALVISTKDTGTPVIVSPTVKHCPVPVSLDVRSGAGLMTPDTQDSLSPIWIHSSVTEPPAVHRAIQAQHNPDPAAQDHLSKTTTTTKAVQSDREEDKEITNSFQTATSGSGFKEEEKTHFYEKGFCCNQATNTEHLLHIAPTGIATISDCATETRVVQGGASQAGLSLSLPSVDVSSPRVRHISEAEVTVSTNVNHHPVVQNPNGQSPGNLNTPHTLGTQNDNEKKAKCTNSRPKLKTEQVKRSRLPFARVSRRLDIRKNRMPQL